MTATSKPKPFEIAGRKIGTGHPTFVIAEIGVNHDGSVQKAIELVKIAAACGADAVKLQIFRATALMHASGSLAAYQKERITADNPVDMLRAYELSREDLRVICKSILELRLIPLATPFSPGDVDTVAALRLPAVKIASPDLVNHLLLTEVAKLGRPMLLSTGAATMAETRQAAAWMAEMSASFALLHCISSYPTSLADANLAWIGELGQQFAVPVGYSDHTTHPLAGALAVAAGATIVEKHLTYDREARGPDHSASADPQQFERYVKQIREADMLCGEPGKRILPAEQDVRAVSRQSLVLRRAIEPGQPIRAEDLTVQRPGTGVSAAHWRQTIGRIAAVTIPAGSMLQEEMLTNAGAKAA